MALSSASLKGETLRISAFGGLNHTDAAKPGEWYEMCNLSDSYSPLLSPRRSRVRKTAFGGDVAAVLYKNGSDSYSDTAGALHYRSGESGSEHTLYTAAEGGAYRFAPMGNRVLCRHPNESESGYLECSGGSPLFSRFLNYEVRQSAVKNNSAFEPKYYYAWVPTGAQTYSANFKNAAFENVLHSENMAQGTYHAAAGNMLNVGFRYCIEQDNGSLFVLNLQGAKTAAQINAMTETQYFIAKSNRKLYKHDAQSGANIEIVAPRIAIFVRNGVESDGAGGVRQVPPPQAAKEGDYIRFEMGASINLAHPFSWEKKRDYFDNEYYEYKTRRACDFELSVAQYHAYTAADTTGWKTDFGWQYYYIVDYHAQFNTWLENNNLLVESEHYTQPFTGTAQGLSIRSDGQLFGKVEAYIDELPEQGTRKLYPAYLKISNTVPVVDAALEHNNRIWGANNTNNEIKASAQGNFKNWDDYRGLASDSYAVSIGSDGSFTASCAIDDYLYFFKEHSYTQLYGTRPANYCTNTVSDFIGISSAAACSLQVIGKSAYYMGIDGRFYRFNGQSTACISKALGDVRYTPLSSAHSGERYYVLAEETTAADAPRRLLVYNTATGLWWKEDADRLERLCNLRGQACAIAGFTCREGGSDVLHSDVLLLDAWEVPPQENNRVAWSCESGLFGLESDRYQYLSKLRLTFESEAGASLEVLARFDNEAVYTPLAKYIARQKGTQSCAIPLKRCAFVRFKIRGIGFSKVYAISCRMAEGGEK